MTFNRKEKALLYVALEAYVDDSLNHMLEMAVIFADMYLVNDNMPDIFKQQVKQSIRRHTNNVLAADELDTHIRTGK